jgi:hypothetical protein
MKVARFYSLVAVLGSGAALYCLPLGAVSSLAPATLEVAPAPGGLFTGALGAKVFPSGPTVVDLANEGTYDPATYGWAVVFDWTTIDVPPDAVITFTNHPSGAPVIWHATGDVDIAGDLQLNGENGANYSSPVRYAQPGPGGFRGGRNGYIVTNTTSAGFGPGGGFKDANGSVDDIGGGGSYGTQGYQLPPYRGLPGPTYGGAGVLPLIGGSGGAGGLDSLSYLAGGGGAGGGAILIASDAVVTLASTASITCNGGTGGAGGGGGADTNPGGYGSGGAIRVVGDSLHIQGAQFYALSTESVGKGRIRFEANASSDPSKLTVFGAFTPTPSISDQTFDIIPQLAPVLQPVAYDPDGVAGSAGWVDISGLTDPGAKLDPPEAADVTGLEAGSITLRIRADNVPFGETVSVRLTEANGQSVLHTSGPLVATGNGMESLVEVEFDLPGGVSAIQLRVDYND